MLVDDNSTDQTIELANELGLDPIKHEQNLGYGGNQKTCYQRALELGADIIVMVHPDYQYSPLLVPAMASMIAYGEYDMVLGSRILAQHTVARACPCTSTSPTGCLPSPRTSCSARSCRSTTPGCGRTAAR